MKKLIVTLLLIVFVFSIVQIASATSYQFYYNDRLREWKGLAWLEGITYINTRAQSTSWSFHTAVWWPWNIDKIQAYASVKDPNGKRVYSSWVAENNYSLVYAKSPALKTITGYWYAYGSHKFYKSGVNEKYLTSYQKQWVFI